MPSKQVASAWHMSGCVRRERWGGVSCVYVCFHDEVHDRDERSQVQEYVGADQEPQHAVFRAL